MKQLSILIFLCSLSTNSAEYLLLKDQMISQILYDQGHITRKWDLGYIESILSYNKLTWLSAKKLPIGFSFNVPQSQDQYLSEKTQQPNTREDNGVHESITETVESIPDTRVAALKLGIQAGVFQEELGFLGGSDRFLYSNMSQQLGLIFESDKEKTTYFSTLFNLKNHIYEEGQNVGVKDRIEKVTHLFRLGLTYRRYHEWKITGFAENEGKLYFDVENDSRSNLSTGNSTNLGANAEWSPFYIEASLWGLGAHYSGKVLSNEFDKNNKYKFYLFSEFYSAGMRADLGYSYTDLEVNSEGVRNRQVELVLNYFFL